MFKFSGLPKLLESSLEEFASCHNSVSEPTLCTSKCGKIALKADIGQYVARCNGCIVDGATRDFLVIRKDDSTNPNVQFTPELLPNGNYALKSNSGQYVARGVHQDTVTVHVDNPTVDILPGC